MTSAPRPLGRARLLGARLLLGAARVLLARPGAVGGPDSALSGLPRGPDPVPLGLPRLVRHVHRLRTGLHVPRRRGRAHRRGSAEGLRRVGLADPPGVDVVRLRPLPRGVPPAAPREAGFRSGSARPLPLPRPSRPAERRLPVVPVFLANTGRILPRGTALFVPFVVRVSIGEPVALPAGVREATACLEEAVRSLATSAPTGG